MATNNPFYVDPGNDFSSGLSGLSGTLSNIRQDRVQASEIQKRDEALAAQKQRQEEATQAAQQAYQSGDPDMMAKVSLQYPEIAQNLHQVVGLNDERKVKEAAGFARDLLMASPEQRESIFQQRIQSLQDQGRDPTHTAQAYQQYLQDPNAAMQGIELDWAAGDPQGYSVIANKAKAQAEAARDARKEAREDRKLDQQMTIAQMNSADRSLTRQMSMLTAQQAATTNDLKRQELQLQIDSKAQALQDNQAKKQEAVQTKYKAADSAITQMDTAIDTARQLLNHPALKNPGLTSAVGIGSALPTRPGSDSANFEALLNTLQAQSFLPVVQSLKGAGLGALSDAEGSKLTASQGAFSVKTKPALMSSQLEAFIGRLEKNKSALQKEISGLPKAAASQPSASGAGASGGWEIIQ